MKLVKFIVRVGFLPITLPCLGLTALATFCADKPDWEYWRNYNSFLFELLP